VSAKHTPGLWRVGSSDDTRYMGELPAGSSYISGPNDDLVAELDSCGVPTVTQWANARLIAAAPELLAALEGLLPMVPGHNEDDTAGRPWLVAARAAIAKARGQA